MDFGSHEGIVDFGFEIYDLAADSRRAAPLILISILLPKCAVNGDAAG
jgi:hypothetical protein